MFPWGHVLSYTSSGTTYTTMWIGNGTKWNFSLFYLPGELYYTYTRKYLPRQHTTRSTDKALFSFISFHSILFHSVSCSVNFCMPLLIILECMLHILEPGFTVTRLYVHLQLKFQFFLVISPNLMVATCLQITVLNQFILACSTQKWLSSTLLSVLPMCGVSQTF